MYNDLAYIYKIFYRKARRRLTSKTGTKSMQTGTDAISKLSKEKIIHKKLIKEETTETGTVQAYRLCPHYTTHYCDVLISLN